MAEVAISSLDEDIWNQRNPLWKRYKVVNCRTPRPVDNTRKIHLEHFPANLRSFQGKFMQDRCKQLIRSLDRVADIGGSFQNIVIVGASGSGKTAIVENYLKAAIGLKCPSIQSIQQYVLRFSSNSLSPITMLDSISAFESAEGAAGIKYVVLEDADLVMSSTQQSFRKAISADNKKPIKFICTCNKLEKIVNSIKLGSLVVSTSQLTSMSDILTVFMRSIHDEGIGNEIEGIRACVVASHKNTENYIESEIKSSESENDGERKEANIESKDDDDDDGPVTDNDRHQPSCVNLKRLLYLANLVWLHFHFISWENVIKTLRRLHEMFSEWNVEEYYKKIRQVMTGIEITAIHQITNLLFGFDLINRTVASLKRVRSKILSKIEAMTRKVTCSAPFMNTVKLMNNANFARNTCLEMNLFTIPVSHDTPLFGPYRLPLQPRIDERVRCRVCTMYPPCKHVSAGHVQALARHMWDKLKNDNDDLCPMQSSHAGYCDSTQRFGKCTYRHIDIMRYNDSKTSCSSIPIESLVSRFRRLDAPPLSLSTSSGSMSRSCDVCPQCTLPWPCRHCAYNSCRDDIEWLMHLIELVAIDVQVYRINKDKADDSGGGGFGNRRSKKKRKQRRLVDDDDDDDDVAAVADDELNEEDEEEDDLNQFRDYYYRKVRVLSECVILSFSSPTTHDKSSQVSEYLISIKSELSVKLRLSPMLQTMSVDLIMNIFKEEMPFIKDDELFSTRSRQEAIRSLSCPLPAPDGQFPLAKLCSKEIYQAKEHWLRREHVQMMRLIDWIADARKKKNAKDREKEDEV